MLKKETVIIVADALYRQMWSSISEWSNLLLNCYNISTTILFLGFSLPIHSFNKIYINIDSTNDIAIGITNTLCL